MPLPAAVPWIAMGLQAMGAIMSSLGQPDEREQTIFDPDLKERFEQVRGYRAQQKALFAGSLQSVSTAQRNLDNYSDDNRFEPGVGRSRMEGRLSGAKAFAGVDPADARADRMRRAAGAQQGAPISAVRDRMKARRQNG